MSPTTWLATLPCTATDLRRRLLACAEGLVYLQREAGGLRNAARLGPIVTEGLAAALTAYLADQPEACQEALAAPFAALGRTFTPRQDALECAAAIVGTAQQIVPLRDFQRVHVQGLLDRAASAMEAGDDDACMTVQSEASAIAREYGQRP